MSADQNPVIVGGGRFTYKDAPDGGGSGDRISLRDIIVEAVQRAADDACSQSASASREDVLSAVEAVACPGTFFTGTANGVCRRAGMPQVYPNLPASVAKASGAINADGYYCERASEHCCTVAARIDLVSHLSTEFETAQDEKDTDWTVSTSAARCCRYDSEWIFATVLHQQVRRRDRSRKAAVRSHRRWRSTDVLEKDGRDGKTDESRGRRRGPCTARRVA